MHVHSQLLHPYDQDRAGPSSLCITVQINKVQFNLLGCALPRHKQLRFFERVVCRQTAQERYYCRAWSYFSWRWPSLLAARGA